MTKKDKVTSEDYPLQSYVREVCLQILRGVVEAQTDEDLGKYIGRAPINADYKDEGANSISVVDFDVSAEVSVNADGQGSVNVATFIKADGKIEKKQTEANRIKFSVPIAIPAPDDQINLRSEIADKRREANRRATEKMRNYNARAKSDPWA